MGNKQESIKQMPDVDTLLKLMQLPCNIILNPNSSLETKININQAKSKCSLEKKGMTIRYDQEKLDANPSSHLSELAKVQGQYKELVSEELHKEYQSLDELISLTSKVKKTLELVPEGMKNRVMNIVKLVLTGHYLIEGTNFKPELETQIQEDNYSISTYFILIKFFEFGQRFLEKNQKEYDGKLQDKDKKLLEECKSEAKDISYLYTRLIDTMQKDIKETRLMLSLFYPPKPAEAE